jgi:hypothetical protein
MGHVADARSPASHDDSGSYGGDDPEVKMTRLATGTLRRPPRGNKTRGGASSQEVAHRFVASSRTASRSRLVPRRQKILRKTWPRGQSLPNQGSWDFDEGGQDLGKKRNPPKPHASP